MIQPWPAGTPCPLEVFPEFEKLLADASYHFADDSGKEWLQGRAALEACARLILDAKVPLWAIQRMRSEIESLVSIDDLLSEMLKLAYKERK